MSFTYTELQQAIKDFTENDETSFVTNLPIFIRSAEDRILYLADLEEFRKNATSALTTNDPFLSVPSDFLAPFSLRITTSNNENFLLIKDVNYIQEYNKGVSNTIPKYYGIFDSSNFIVGPTPDSNYTVELHYYYSPASLTAGAGSGTTWLYSQRFEQEIQRLKDLGEARENSDAYRRGLPDRPRT